MVLNVILKMMKHTGRKQHTFERPQNDEHKRNFVLWTTNRKQNKWDGDDIDLVVSKEGTRILNGLFYEKFDFELLYG